LALSGRGNRADGCPLFGIKRTLPRQQIESGQTAAGSSLARGVHPPLKLRLKNKTSEPFLSERIVINLFV
jgi:hypothetical protein